MYATWCGIISAETSKWIWYTGLALRPTHVGRQLGDNAHGVRQLRLSSPELAIYLSKILSLFGQIATCAHLQ
jgi:hypothetical protein